MLLLQFHNTEREGDGDRATNNGKVMLLMFWSTTKSYNDAFKMYCCIMLRYRLKSLLSPVTSYEL